MINWLWQIQLTCKDCIEQEMISNHKQEFKMAVLQEALEMFLGNSSSSIDLCHARDCNRYGSLEWSRTMWTNLYCYSSF